MKTTEKFALITGGTRMGQTIAEALGAHGYRIGLTYRKSAGRVKAAAGALQKLGIQTETFYCDVTSLDSIRMLMRAVQTKTGRLDLLIHMASIYDLATAEQDRDAKLYRAQMATHADSSYMVSVQAAPLLSKAKPGRIVLISDWTSASGSPHYKEYTGYYVSKLAVKGITEALALNFAPGIMVNAIAPGPMLPPPGLSKRTYEQVKRVTPMERWGGPEEIAKAVLFLTQTNFVTGETIRVDGGRHLL